MRCAWPGQASQPEDKDSHQHSTQFRLHLSHLRPLLQPHPRPSAVLIDELDPPINSNARRFTFRIAPRQTLNFSKNDPMQSDLKAGGIPVGERRVALTRSTRFQVGTMRVRVTPTAEKIEFFGFVLPKAGTQP
jgi:hypothetical protein